MRVLANSCASTLRYFEGRDDFNFLKSSRLRLGYYDGDVNLEVCLCVRACVIACRVLQQSVWCRVVCTPVNTGDARYQR